MPIYFVERSDTGTLDQPAAMSKIYASTPEGCFRALSESPEKLRLERKP